MKKFFASFLALALFAGPVSAADQWTKGDPQGTELNGTIDNIIRINNEAQDRLDISYKQGLVVDYATAATLTVRIGEIAIPNAAGSVVRYRRTTGATTITWSDIDTGAEANSTQYYVYATADTDITGMVFKISTSSSAPTGMTYYRKIGYFYNDASGNIVSVGNIGDGCHNTISVTGTTNITTTSSTYSDMDDMVIYFVSSGGQVQVVFSGPVSATYSSTGTVQLTVDGSQTTFQTVQEASATETTPQQLTFQSQTVLSAGAHTIKAQWKSNNSTSLTCTSVTRGQRTLTATEK